jgi:hypothetical protein
MMSSALPTTMKRLEMLRWSMANPLASMVVHVRNCGKRIENTSLEMSIDAVTLRGGRKCSLIASLLLHDSVWWRHDSLLVFPSLPLPIHPMTTPAATCRKWNGAC